MRNLTNSGGLASMRKKSPPAARTHMSFAKVIIPSGGRNLLAFDKHKGHRHSNLRGMRSMESLAFVSRRRLMGQRALASLAAAAASWMLAPHVAFGQTYYTWNGPSGSTQDWEVPDPTNWIGGTSGTYPNNNTDIALFAGTTAASTIDLSQPGGDTVREISGDYSATLGQMQSYTFQDQQLTVDINRSSSAGFAIDCENGSGTAMTFNNNVLVEDTTATGNPSQVIISQQFGPAAEGTLTFNGSLTMGNSSAPPAYLRCRTAA
jgi:hypothetical protein